jgi:L-seryl-tRNA(Ser) seleniumtransferase
VVDADGHLALRRLPAVGTLLASPELEPLIARHGRTLVTDAVRRVLDEARQSIRQHGTAVDVSPRDVVRAIDALTTRSLRRVVNATGVLLHTNLGRAPLAEEAQQAMLDVARGYSTVELDVAAGTRGDRHRHISDVTTSIVGGEGAIVFNNNAGAVLVMLAALCRGKEVIVARGELVEIGGGFRVPDVMRESGCTLVEVGTTNKVYVRDYEAAITERTAAILKVHRSNFAIVGFVAEPSTKALAELTTRRGLPLLYDLGSGLLADEDDLGASWGLVHGTEPRPQEILRDGADLVAFSGDKLLGGPQAGIIAGRAALLEKVRRHPLARALRADKLTLAALEATLRLYKQGRAAEIPVVRQLAEPIEVLAARAKRLAERLGATCPGLRVDVVDDEAVAGGGSLPLARFPTRVVLVGEPGEPGRALAEALRGCAPPVITRVVDDRVAMDVRSVFEDDVIALGGLVEEAWARSTVRMKRREDLS